MTDTEKSKTPSHLTTAKGVIGSLLEQLYQLQSFSPDDAELEEAISKAEAFVAEEQEMYLIIDDRYCGEYEVLYSREEADAEHADRDNHEEVHCYTLAA